MVLDDEVFDSLNITTLTSLQYLSGTIPKSLYDEIYTEIKAMMDDNFKSSTSYEKVLAGKIKREYILPNSANSIEQFMQQTAPLYWKVGKREDLAKRTHIVQPAVLKKDGSFDYSKSNPLKDVWVNFQERYEYNPIHKHSGDLSFVIWIKIPYDIEKERKKFNDRIKVNNSQSSAFIFTYVDPFNENLDAASLISEYRIPIDKSYEGKFILFPSILLHSVTPFYTSKDYRISVAGNLKIL